MQGPAGRCWAAPFAQLVGVRSIRQLRLQAHPMQTTQQQLTSLPMVTQKLRRLFLRPKISKYLPAGRWRAAGHTWDMHACCRRHVGGSHHCTAHAASHLAPGAPACGSASWNALHAGSFDHRDPHLAHALRQQPTVGHKLLNQLVNLLWLLALPSPLAAVAGERTGQQRTANQDAALAAGAPAAA